MQLEGVIVNGRVEFDAPADLPDGTRVRVEPVADVPFVVEPTPATVTSDRPLSPLAERLLALAGKAEELSPADRSLSPLNLFLLSVAGKAVGLPSDMAENHDHYIHGTRKR